VTERVRKRIRPNVDAQSKVGSERDIATLESLAWAGVLSTAQLERLHFPSRRRAQRRLRALLDHGLVRAHLQGELLQRDNLYTLSQLGLDRLVEEGAFPDGVPPLARVPAVPKQRHVLAVRDVFVAFRAREQAGHLALVDFRFEGDLAREQVFKSHGIIPDALAVVAREGTEVSILVEVDAGTETTTTLKAKFAKWEGAFGAGHGVFGVPTTHLFVVALREGRRRTLGRLVEEAGLHPRTETLLLDALPAHLASPWPHALAARAGGTERPPPRPETPPSTDDHAADEAAFRPVRRVLRL
jgi:hypothetical protein